MPDFAGLSHVSLSVRDRHASRAWYGEVLGFEVLEEIRQEAYEEWVLLHPQNKVVLCLQQHRANRGEEFDPARTGGDHLGLRVDSRDALEEWELWFDKLAVDYTPTVDKPYGSVLCFKDPDRIQLELFFTPGHP